MYLTTFTSYVFVAPGKAARLLLICCVKLYVTLLVVNLFISTFAYLTGQPSRRSLTTHESHSGAAFHLACGHHLRGSGEAAGVTGLGAGHVELAAGAAGLQCF